mmetsp:Transcript_146985/g.469734  ORF Transcript_146985/g.469734 Transcript_146985/m.469734 type:complete len:347 (-) Transcript_146985:139-1179(-)
MLVSGDSNFFVSFSGVVLPPGSMRLAEEPLRPRMMALMPPTFRADRERVLEAVRQDGSALGWADAKLRADPGVVREAVRKHGALQFAAPELCTDRDIVLEAVRQDGSALRFAGENLRADREVVTEAVRKHGMALQFGAGELRGDRDIVIQAVQQEGWALGCAAIELCSDCEVMLEAVRQNGRALGCADPALRADRDIVLAAVRQNGRALGCADAALRADLEVVLEAARQSVAALEYASEDLRSDRSDPALTPASVRANPFAVGGSAAVVCSVSELTATDCGIAFRASVGLGGREPKGTLPWGTSLGHLGAQLRIEEGKGYIYMVLPGGVAPVRPVDVNKRLADFIS